MIKNLIISAIVGAALFYMVHTFFIDKVERVASYDIFLGGIFEVFLIQAIFFFYGQQQDKKFQKHLDKHLEQIEKMVKKKL
jgi:hypothetical protein